MSDKGNVKVKLVFASDRERLPEAKQSDQRTLSFVAKDKPGAFQLQRLGFVVAAPQIGWVSFQIQQCQADRAVSLGRQHDFEQCSGKGKMSIKAQQL